jgi:uncharacterized protein YraI
MSILARLSLVVAVVTVPSMLIGCSVEQADGGEESEELVGAEEDDGTDGRGAESVVGTVAAGAQLRTTANLNLRSSPSTSARILHVIPKGSLVTVVSGTPKSGWYNIKHGGQAGWGYGVYLDKVASSGGGGGGSTAIDAGIARAKAGVGFSYWWGHGRWSSSGPTASTKGSCSGSCPSCSHSGSYGADCSGYVAKIWRVPASNDVLTDDSHPYYTGNFVTNTSLWSGVSRGSAKRGDAFVYNSGGAGHIFLFESGDGWGSMWAYEAKGCSYGIVRNLRTAGSNYKAIRRAGW